MSFNVTPYLRDIDAEIEQHRKAIAHHQVAIQQLEDMRVLMMQREERRAQLNGAASPFGALPGVEIAVRDQLAPPPLPPLNRLGNPVLSEAEKAQKNRDYQREWKARQREERQTGLNRAGNRRGMNNPVSRHVRISEEIMHAVSETRARIVALLAEADGPLYASDFRMAFGFGHLSHKSREMRRVNNTLSRMVATGHLRRDEQYRYSLP